MSLSYLFPEFEVVRNEKRARVNRSAFLIKFYVVPRTGIEPATY